MIWVIYKPSGEIVGAAASEDWANMAAGDSLSVASHPEQIDIREYTVADGVLVRKSDAAIAEQEAARRYEAADRQARLERGRRLMKSDWTQAPDAPVDAAAWATYRQALRDITDQAKYPFEITWPEVPT